LKQKRMLKKSQKNIPGFWIKKTGPNKSIIRFHEYPF
jgi:hypothetical protein